MSSVEAQHGAPPPLPSRDPFEWVLWENVAYLVSDEKRQAAFDALTREVGTRPEKILAAPREVLYQVAEQGGMHPLERAAKLAGIAETALREFDGASLSVVSDSK